MKLNLKNIIIGMAFLSQNNLYSQNNPIAESILSESKKYPTTTHYIYKVQESSRKNFHDSNTLDKIIEAVENKFPDKKEYSEREVIDILVFTKNEMEKCGLKYREDKFDCDDASFMYLAIAEKFDIPFYAVMAPEHLFVRYDPNGKHNSENHLDSINEGDFNWEATAGEIVPDNDYKSIKNISEKSIKNGAYMKNLSKEELIALSYENKGTYFLMKGEYNTAIDNYNTAVNLNPRFLGAYFNRANSFALAGDYDSAIKDYTKIVHLDPKDIRSYKCRSYAYRLVGERIRAKEDRKKFRELKKEFRDFKKDSKH